MNHEGYLNVLIVLLQIPPRLPHVLTYDQHFKHFLWLAYSISHIDGQGLQNLFVILMGPSK